jgi:hypothetical protein
MQLPFGPQTPFAHAECVQEQNILEHAMGWLQWVHLFDHFLDYDSNKEIGVKHKPSEALT